MADARRRRSIPLRFSRGPLQGDLRHRARGARRRGRRARLPVRAVDREPDDRLARAVRVPGDDSAGRHRRGAQGGAGALGALPQYIDTEIANLREGHASAATRRRSCNVRIVIDQIERSDRRRPTRRFSRRRTRDKTSESSSSRSTALVTRPADAGVHTVSRLPRAGVPAGGARRRSPSPRNPDGAALLRRRRPRAQLAADAGQGGPRARPAAGRSPDGGDEGDRRAVVPDVGRPGAARTAADRSAVPVQEPRRS